MPSNHRFADVNGTRLYYELAGDGRPLVLIHGFSLDTRMWDDQFETFARRYQVLRYDMRGFGRSALPASAPYAHADDLKSLLERLGIAQAVVAGLSLGGGMALHFALAYPDMARALVLIDSTLGGHPWSPQARARDEAVWSAGKEAGVEAARRLWLAHPLFAPAHENPAVSARLGRIISDYSGFHWVNRDPQRWPDPPAIQRLDEIRAPVLVVVGERDLPDFHVIADTLRQRLPTARKVIVPGAGHMANMENPNRVNETIFSFLEEL